MKNKKTYEDIKTYGIKYAGSKLKLLPYIYQTIESLDNIKTVLDGFSGTTRVSQGLDQLGYNVISNDISAWSKVFGNTFLIANKPKEFYDPMIRELNSLKGKEGWFYHNYSSIALNGKAPFQDINLKKLDAIRNKIDTYHLEEIDKDVLLSSLIFALDKVDNTIGHFSSYLSEWSQRSFNEMKLVVPEVRKHNHNNTVLCGDVFDTIKRRKFDLAYYDPPYGSNNEKMPPSRVRYSSYYHIWTTIIKNDKPKLFGKVGRREDTRDLIASSVFEEYRKNGENHYIATEAIKKLIKLTKARYILFSYSNGGRATKEELISIFNDGCRLIKIIEIDYKSNVMATMKWTNEWLNNNDSNKEYLFLISKE